MGKAVSETQAKGCSHARTQYYIEGEGYCDTETKGTYPSKGMGCPAHNKEPQEPVKNPVFRFCRLFPKGTTDQSEAALVKLGHAMVDNGPEEVGNSELPGGFTYLGQFIDHDITRDETEGFPTDGMPPEEVLNKRSPHLDLDSVYGDGPKLSGHLYEADGIHLKIGRTTAVGADFPSMPNDLPRMGPEGESGKAIIGDHRNDENLAVAQTHLAFLKFHNKVADQTEGSNPEERFENARKTVTQHYQSIVWHHFVPWIVDQAIYQDVSANGRKFYIPGGVEKGKALCMPIEFSVAAYRFGHSLVRNSYEWNRVFNSNQPNPQSQGTLDNLFNFSQLSGFIGQRFPTVPSNWIIDWTRFFDFSDNQGVSNHPQSNKTRKIDTNLAIKLDDLNEFAGQEEALRSLAVRNLLRGKLVGLPTGQEVAAIMGVTPLSQADLLGGPHAAELQQGNFHINTPLFYYILREAQVQHDGLRLGQVGSRIVAETFHGLIENSKYSILKETLWKPSLHPQNPLFYTMSDMLTFVDDLNPLGN